MSTSLEKEGESTEIVTEEESTPVEAEKSKEIEGEKLDGLEELTESVLKEVEDKEQGTKQTEEITEPAPESMETDDAPIVVQAMEESEPKDSQESQDDDAMSSNEDPLSDGTKSPKGSISNGAKTDENLLSEEHLDRESPEIWPEKIPGVQDFVQEHGNEAEAASPPTWTKGLTQDDVDQMHEFGNMSNAQLILEIKKLYDHAYKIGVEEAKEMSRGKILQIFLNAKKK